MKLRLSIPTDRNRNRHRPYRRSSASVAGIVATAVSHRGDLLASLLPRW
jgi:hypothetical protein